MHLQLNGTPREVAATTLTELIDELQLDANHVAIELNQAIMARSQFATTRLADGDRLEVIQFVGGG